MQVKPEGADLRFTDSQGQIWMRFAPSDERRYIPAWKVLAGEVGAEDVRGRIVLIGARAAGLLDLRTTPLDASIPGVEIHAQVIEQVLAGVQLNRPDFMYDSICVWWILCRRSTALSSTTTAPPTTRSR